MGEGKQCFTCVCVISEVDGIGSSLSLSLSLSLSQGVSKATRTKSRVGSTSEGKECFYVCLWLVNGVGNSSLSGFSMFF